MFNKRPVSRYGDTELSGFGWGQMIAVFWVVLNGVRSSAPRRVLFLMLVAIGAVTSMLACYQHFVNPTWIMLGRVQADQFLSRSSGSFGIPNSFAAFLILLVPALGALAVRSNSGVRWRIVCGALGALLAYALVLTISRGAWLGLALALGVGPLISLRQSLGRRVIAAASALAIVMVFGATLYAVSPNVRSRLVGLVHDRGEVTRPLLWRAAWQMFREHPATGTGAGSFNVMFEKFRPEGFLNEPQWAHNDYLNTLSDYGAIGFGLFFGAIVMTVRRCARRSSDRVSAPDDWLEAQATRHALVVGLLAFALQLSVDFHFKIPALAMAFATLAGLVMAPAWPIAEAGSGRRRIARMGNFLGAVVAAALVVVVFVPHFWAEALRLRAREAIDRTAGRTLDPMAYRETLRSVRVDLVRATALDPTNAQAWADVAYADALWANISPSEVLALGREAEAAAQRAITLAPDCAEFWVRLGIARDMKGEWFDAGLDFSRATTLAPNTSWAWFYQADHFSRRVTERGLAEAALALCLRLDPGNPDGLALRQRLAISQKAKP